MHKKIKKLLISLMITTIIFLVTLIVFKSNSSLKNWFNYNVLESTFSFAWLNEKYKNAFGASIPFKELMPEVEPVFNEKLSYTAKSKYLDGVKLTVSNNYLIPNIEKGLVIFVGEKENYGLCVIIQQIDAVEAMYCNVSNIAVKLYDYIDAGMLIGEVDDNQLILSFKDNNGVVDYEKYI